MLYFISFILLCHTVIIPVLHVEMLSVSITILLREGPLVSSGHELDQSLVVFLANGVFFVWIESVCGRSTHKKLHPSGWCSFLWVETPAGVFTGEVVSLMQVFNYKKFREEQNFCFQMLLKTLG